MKHSIRQAHLDDLNDIVDIDTQAFSPYGTQETPEIIRARLEAFPEGVLVAEKDSEVIGYSSAEKWLTRREPAINEDPHSTHHPTGKIFCITGMAVKLSHRNTGVGSDLLRTLLLVADAHSCERVVLETSHAEPFYIHRGFELLAYREHGNTKLSIVGRNLLPPNPKT